jgi:hypothetical protein
MKQLHGKTWLFGQPRFVTSQVDLICQKYHGLIYGAPAVIQNSPVPVQQVEDMWLQLKLRTHMSPVEESRWMVGGRVSFATSFDSKQPKLEPAETKRLFRLFRFNPEIESFGVSIEPKQTEEQPKQCDREHILVFFSQNLRFFRFFSVCFDTVCFGCFGEFRCFD